MLNVQRWAEIRRMRFVEGLSIAEIVRRTAHGKNTVRRAIRSDSPPAYRRPARPSKLDPHKPRIHELLRSDPAIPSSVIRERITEEAGYRGGKTILDDYVRELRQLFAPPRTYQRTTYRPGDLPVRPLGAVSGDPGRPRPDPPRMGGHGRDGPLARRGRHARLLQGAAGSDLRMNRCLSLLGGLTLCAPEHERALRELRSPTPGEVEVEVRPLERYDALIPASPRPPSSPTSSAR